MFHVKNLPFAPEADLEIRSTTRLSRFSGVTNRAASLSASEHFPYLFSL
jgi:hypothetical protein